jgi:hypothetical protein
MIIHTFGWYAIPTKVRWLLILGVYLTTTSLYFHLRIISVAIDLPVFIWYDAGRDRDTKPGEPMKITFTPYRRGTKTRTKTMSVDAYAKNPVLFTANRGGGKLTFTFDDAAERTEYWNWHNSLPILEMS